jgi:hypothetical protein
MSTRKIKDAKDLSTNELIYFKGHAKATFMTDGTTVEDAVNSKVSKVDGKQLSTEDFTTALKNKLSGLSNYDDTQINQTIQSLQTQINTLVSGNASDAIESFNEIIAFLSGIEDSQSLDSIVASIEQQISSKVEASSLAKVATSGSYNDLSNKPTIPAEQVNADWNATSGKAQILNKPTIPTAVTESTVSGWGFTKNTGTYSKPSGGIPKTDLASAVQTSLGKADTALQSHQDISGKQDKLVSGTNIKTINNTSILGSGNISITGGSGTITEVKANGTSVATSGVANIPAASTSAYGVTKLSSATNSTSEVLAATPKAVKSAYDLANGKVSKVKVNGVEKSPSSGVVDIGSLVTSVKVNGASNTPTNGEVDLGKAVSSVKINGFTYTPTNGLVDLGNVSGGSSGGSASGYPIEYIIFMEDMNLSANPHTYYKIDNSTVGSTSPTLYIDLTNDIEGMTNEYVFELPGFNDGDIAFNTDDYYIEWANGVPPIFDGKRTVISICEHYGLWFNVE